MPAPATNILPLPIARHASAPAPQTPRTSARDNLNRAIAILDGALHALEQAREPLQRLAAVDQAAQQAEAEWSRLRAEHDQLVGEWIASGAKGHRPPMSSPQVEIELKIAGLAADATAARKAIPQSV